MENKRTLTFGAMLCKLATSSEDVEDRKEALEELEEVVSGHSDELFLRLCMSEAEKGNFLVNIGRCVPPDMKNEEITFEKGVCNTIVAKW